MKKNILLFFAVTSSCLTFAQPVRTTIDRVIAVVGKSAILESELETQCLQLKLSGQTITRQTRCQVLEQMLFRKLLLAQAEHDSVTITDDQVEQELDRRFRVYVYQLGSVEAFEKFYGKTIDKYKEDFRDDIRDILMSQKMQQKITGDITTSPNEVKKYFESMAKDSVPFIN